MRCAWIISLLLALDVSTATAQPKTAPAAVKGILVFKEQDFYSERESSVIEYRKVEKFPLIVNVTTMDGQIRRINTTLVLADFDITMLDRDVASQDDVTRLSALVESLDRWASRVPRLASISGVRVAREMLARVAAGERRVQGQWIDRQKFENQERRMAADARKANEQFQKEEAARTLRAIDTRLLLLETDIVTAEQVALVPALIRSIRAAVEKHPTLEPELRAKLREAVEIEKRLNSGERRVSGVWRRPSPQPAAETAQDSVVAGAVAPKTVPIEPPNIDPDAERRDGGVGGLAAETMALQDTTVCKGIAALAFAMKGNARAEGLVADYAHGRLGPVTMDTLGKLYQLLARATGKRDIQISQTYHSSLSISLGMGDQSSAILGITAAKNAVFDRIMSAITAEQAAALGKQLSAQAKSGKGIDFPAAIARAGVSIYAQELVLKYPQTATRAYLNRVYPTN